MILPRRLVPVLVGCAVLALIAAGLALWLTRRDDAAGTVPLGSGRLSARDEIAYACGIGSRLADVKLDATKRFQTTKGPDRYVVPELGLQLALTVAAGRRDDRYAAAAEIAQPLYEQTMLQMRYADADEVRAKLADACDTQVDLRTDPEDRRLQYVHLGCRLGETVGTEWDSIHTSASIADTSSLAASDPFWSELDALELTGELAPEPDEAFTDAAHVVRGSVLTYTPDTASRQKKQFDQAITDLAKTCSPS